MSSLPVEHDTQKTSAIGADPYLGATQGAPLDKGLMAVLTLATHFKAEPFDAREIAFGDFAGYGKWKKSEATGVHAEVLIIRAWLALLVNPSGDYQGVPLATAISQLRGRKIQASQPACWCCAKLMKQYGILFPSTAGSKPLAGWRHPLAGKTVPNADIPAKESDITDEWLNKVQSGFK
ncbi:hypothetical protein [Piscinibacter terrae]|uniref:Uncharacterized protein n=1 Tax=Piscinibacter terrae TaxID=2496871 RepID=A0A3N7JIZ8_9BURK|nr:hypothetical protein [Albitalea terrae]RQP21409.1 hypothetical protein DZC73_28420 [Albitalea terrae]